MSQQKCYYFVGKIRQNILLNQENTREIPRVEVRLKNTKLNIDKIYRKCIHL